DLARERISGADYDALAVVACGARKGRIRSPTALHQDRRAVPTARSAVGGVRSELDADPTRFSANVGIATFGAGWTFGADAGRAERAVPATAPAATAVLRIAEIDAPFTTVFDRVVAISPFWKWAGHFAFASQTRPVGVVHRAVGQRDRARACVT